MCSKRLGQETGLPVVALVIVLCMFWGSISGRDCLKSDTRYVPGRNSSFSTYLQQISPLHTTHRFLARVAEICSCKCGQHSLIHIIWGRRDDVCRKVVIVVGAHRAGVAVQLPANAEWLGNLNKEVPCNWFKNSSQLQRRRFHRKHFNPGENGPAAQVDENMHADGVDGGSRTVSATAVIMRWGGFCRGCTYKSFFSNCSHSLQLSLMNDRSLVPSSPARAMQITSTLLAS